MNNIVWVKSEGNYYKLINKLNNLKVIIFDTYYDQKNIFIKINKDNLVKIKKYLPSYKFKIVKELGIGRFLKVIKKHYHYFCALIFGLILLLFLSNIIVKVEVVHSSKKIRNLIYDALDAEGIKRLTFKKDYTEINKIKEKILERYPNDLEWLEIEVRGMKYIVRVEQRIITKKKDEPRACNIVALKSGIITDILTTNGISLVTRGNYVSQGDVLISGNILFNNEVKNVVCARGNVKAEVWYTVKVTMPLKYQLPIKTGKKRYNFVYDNGLGKKSLFRNRLINFEYKDKKIISLLGTHYYWRTMEEYYLVTNKYKEEEALNVATNLALQKIKINKKDHDKIIAQKVLKKEVNDSTISLEIFLAIEEEIGTKEEFENSNEVE